MSNSKPVPPFVLDVLRYLNRDQLERFSIVCRPLKNLIERYFHSKPYRVFERLQICGGSYALVHNNVQWHPNRDDYSVQQFLDGQESNYGNKYYSSAEMLPYLGPTVRIEYISIDDLIADEDYNPKHIAEMESIAHLWRDGVIYILNGDQICAEGFQPILNSPTVLQCRELHIDFDDNANFSFKDYKVLYSVKMMDITYINKKTDPNIWPQFLEQPGAKPVVVLKGLHRECVNKILDQLTKDFFSAVSPNTYQITFEDVDEPLTVFREMNYRSREKLELKRYTLKVNMSCSKPYRVFDRLEINGGQYALIHNNVQWHPNRDDYSVQQFLARQECSIGNRGYSFAEMCPYLGPTVRIQWTFICVAGGITYNPEHIAEMESIAYLWRDGDIHIWNARNDGSRIGADDFQLILNSPTILQCRTLYMENAHFSFKDYKVLYSVKFIEIDYENAEADPDFWPEFLEQPGVKPVVVLRQLHPDSVVNLLERLYKDFSKAVSPKAYKIILAQNGRLMIKSKVQSFKGVYSYSQPTVPLTDEELIGFQDKNKTLGEKWEFKKPFEFALEYPEYELSENNKYVLERSSI
ncbi:hypothetical protein Ddc_19238 [Ditylenchus destructor]|nr:hypothetical protein Ddc_19238 [Ditylenchus destructor]